MPFGLVGVSSTPNEFDLMNLAIDLPALFLHTIGAIPAIQGTNHPVELIRILYGIELVIEHEPGA